MELAAEDMEVYYPCCGKSICRECFYSFGMSRKMKCPFCNSDHSNKTAEETIQEIDQNCIVVSKEWDELWEKGKQIQEELLDSVESEIENNILEQKCRLTTR